MKKLVTLFMSVLILCLALIPLCSAETDKEITFRNIPWGTDYTTVKDDNPDWNLYKLAGEIYDVKSVDNVLTGAGGFAYTEKYEYKDINIISHNWGDIAVPVAGYTSTTINLYYAYVPVDGILTRKEKDSALYGASYEFEKINNVAPVEKDLIGKLTSLYGEPDKRSSDQSWTGTINYRYYYWYGANDTVVCLKIRESQDSEDSCYYISYAWLKGDELLDNANQSEIDRVNAADKGIQDIIDSNTNNTDGL